MESFKQATATLDTKRLSRNLRKIVEEYLLPQSKTTPSESLCLDTLVKVSQLVNFNRVKVDSELLGQTPANVYGVIFMPSGSGKDKPIIKLDMLMEESIKDYEGRIQKWMDEELIEVTKKAEEMKGLAMRSYIEQNRPRRLLHEYGDGTYEGLVAVREAYEKAGFGAPLIKISEYADYISSDNNSRGEFLSTITEIFDMGNSSAKATQKNKEGVIVRGVPTTVLFHTSLYGVNKNKITYTKMVERLGRGMARRSICCYPEIPPYVAPDDIDSDFDAQLSSMRTIKLYRDDLSAMFTGVYRSTIGGVVYNYTEDAERLLYAYGVELKERASSSLLQEISKSELSGRSWKAYKLAGVIAAFEHPKVHEVNIDDIDLAIYLTELYGLHFERFIGGTFGSEVEEFFEMFRANLGVAFSKTDLRRWGIFGKNTFADRWDKLLPDLEELCTQYGYRLDKIEGRPTLYTLHKEELTTIGNIRISVSSDITKDFELKEVPFEELHKITNSDLNYSPSQFKDGYRTTENYIPGNNLVVLDVDEGWTVAEATEFIQSRELTALITTTKSHLLEKNGHVSERFRILLPTQTTFSGTPDQFKYLMSEVGKFFLGKPDPVAKDCTRFYYGNPNAEHVYLQGKRFLDLSWFSLAEPSPIPPTTMRNFDNGDDKLLANWFIENTSPGNRNNMLFRAFMMCKDKGKNDLHAYEFVREINNRISSPLPEREIKIICRQ